MGGDGERNRANRGPRDTITRPNQDTDQTRKLTSSLYTPSSQPVREWRRSELDRIRRKYEGGPIIKEAVKHEPRDTGPPPDPLNLPPLPPVPLVFPLWLVEGSVCKVGTQDPENLDEELKPLVTVWCGDGSRKWSQPIPFASSSTSSGPWHLTVAARRKDYEWDKRDRIIMETVKPRAWDRKEWLQVSSCLERSHDSNPWNPVHITHSLTVPTVCFLETDASRFNLHYIILPVITGWILVNKI